MIDINRQWEERQDIIHSEIIISKMTNTDEECPECYTNNVLFDEVSKGYWCDNCCQWTHLELDK